MPTVHVKGVGDIDLPDGLSQDEMAQAIESHPDVIKYNQTQKANQGSMVVGHGGASVPKSVANSEDTFSNLAYNFAKGVPIAGAMAKPTPNASEFEQANPGLASGAQFAGGTLATLPLSELSVARGLAPGFSKFAAQTGAGAGVGGGINAMDTAARGGSAEDIKNSAIMGALAGGASPTLSRVASPGINLSDRAANLATTIGGGALGLGHGGGVEALLGALLGHTNYPARILQEVAGNRVFQSPNAQSMLSALLQQGSRSIDPSQLNALQSAPTQ